MSGGETMDGILIIDKPIGMTSHDVVYKVRKSLAEKRIGHTGTLDPNASGVLVLCVGTATKLVKYFTEHDKTYLAGIDVGYRTDTYDLEGTVQEVKRCETLTDAIVDETLRTFLGSSSQIPPDYSAIRVDGKKLYEYARKHQVMPEIQPRPIQIEKLNRTTPVIVTDGVAHFNFFVHCGKGMYVRALCRDIGLRLGSVATMTDLRRLRVGEFTLEEAAPLATVLSGQVELKDPIPYLGMPRLSIDEATRRLVLNGVFLPVALFSDTQDTILMNGSVALAIYTYDDTIKMMRLSVLF